MRFFALVLTLLCVVSANAYAVEVNSATAIRSPNDWAVEDRESYLDASKSLQTLDALKAWVQDHGSNTFIKAAIVNTRDLKPKEYRTIRERNAYYDYISFLIEGQNFVPVGNREVKFFHAAASVTVRLELGVTESTAFRFIEDHFPAVARFFGITPEAVKLVSDINGELFPKNMRIIRDLVFNWQVPLDPRAVSPHEPMPTLDFDLAMVEFEQLTVQAFINRNAVPNRVLSDVNRMMGYGLSLNLVKQVRPWLTAAGFKPLDFANYRWRVAVGRALVFLFHKKDSTEYLNYMKAHPPENRDRPALYSGLLSPSAQTTDAAGDFTILGSWKTREGALRHVSELRKRFLGIDVAVYPPYGKDRYWTVASSSFASEAVASELRLSARRMRVARDAYVLRRRAVDPLGAPVLPEPASIQLRNVPSLLDVASKDKVPESAASIVTVFQSPDETLARARLRELEDRYGSLKLDLFQLKESGNFAVGLATYATAQRVDEALAVARHIGIPQSDISVSAIVDPQNLERVAVTRSIQTTWSRVADCYKTGSVTVEALHACSGFWATPATLTRCVLESDCRLLNSQALPTDELVDSFLRQQGLKRTDELKLLPGAVPVVRDGQVLAGQIQNCRNQAQGDQGIFTTCMMEAAGDRTASAALRCQQSGGSRNEVLACVAAASGQPDLKKISECTKGDKPDILAVSKCLAGPAQAAEIDRLSSCLQAVNSQGGALAQCAANALPPAERAMVNCLVQNSQTPIGAAACALPSSPEKQLALKAFACSQKTDDTAQVAACVAGLVDNGAGQVTQCVAAGGSKAAVMSCMLSTRPELRQAAKILTCATGGTDAASLIANCADGVVDPKVTKIASCVAQNSSDAAAMAGCAAASFVPKELGPAVGCASQSTGGADFALCMAGPQMNAEWRIAAECAVQSGGVAPAFAACAAGRLTIREFTKCLSGRVGKDCFGENNTIVSAFRTVAHDLESCATGGACLGPNNDLVKVGHAVEEAFADAGHALERLGDDFRRSDPGRIICGIFGC